MSLIQRGQCNRRYCENNDYYANSDSNCDGSMREVVHSPLSVALMPLFKHGAINSKVLAHSHTWASPATGAVSTILSMGS